MLDATAMLAKWSVPLGVATTIVGGSAWLTTTRNRVEQMASEVLDLREDYRVQATKVTDRIQRQEEKIGEVQSRLAAIEAKLDFLISGMRK